MTSMPRPEIKILPFVVFLEQEPSVRLNTSELQDYFWLSIYQIETSRGTAKFGSFEGPAFMIGKIVIWGLTYRILESFLEILRLINYPF